MNAVIFVKMLKALGVEINPEQISGFVTWVQTNLPNAIVSFNDMIARQKRIEEKLDAVLKSRAE